MAKTPNLFIVGAPKSGTTALTSYLASHPDIYMASKESHFFGSDLAFDGIRAQIPLDAYLAGFEGATEERYRAEASIGYLYSSRAAKEIHDFSPDARIVAILRNPVDMVHSLHSEVLFQGDEDIVDFDEALAAEPERAEGRRIPPTCQALWTLLYRRVGHYADQVERYFDEFGRERVHIIVFDDFREDAPLSYRKTLEFLELDPDHQPDFPVVNANKVARSPAAVRLLRQPPAGVRRIVRLVVPNQHFRRRLGHQVQALNTAERPRPPMTEETRRSLQQDFAEDVARLGKLLDRDLSGWTTG